MAVESRRYGDRDLLWSARFRDARPRSRLEGVKAQTLFTVWEVLPWLALAVVVTSPFIIYAMGQARLDAAMNRRTALLRQIRNDRVEITQLRDELRSTVSPAVLVRWAQQQGMQPASEVITLGIRTEPAESRDSDTEQRAPALMTAAKTRGDRRIP